MIEQIWKLVPWSKSHEASSDGQIRSIDRTILGRFRKGIILKPHKDKGGYLRVSLNENADPTPLVHRIIALIFIDNPDNKPWVNHKDGNKQNNNLENLEWSTISENVIHAYANGLNWKGKGEGCATSKLNNTKVLEIRRRSENGELRKNLGKEFLVTPECISAIVLRKNWTHI